MLKGSHTTIKKDNRSDIKIQNIGSIESIEIIENIGSFESIEVLKVLKY